MSRCKRLVLPQQRREQMSAASQVPLLLFLTLNSRAANLIPDVDPAFRFSSQSRRTLVIVFIQLPFYRPPLLKTPLHAHSA